VPVGVVGDQVQRDRVARQRLLGHHVGDQHHQHLVGQLDRRPAEPFHLLAPVLGRQVGEEVGRLPRLLDGQQVREVLADKRLDPAQHFALGGKGFGL